MNASRMMAKRTTTSQKKNTTIPGMAYPATSLVLATAPGYPARPNLFGTLGTPNSSPDPPPVQPTPEDRWLGQWGRGGSSICRGPAGGWPISRASTSPANAVPCPIDATNQSLLRWQGRRGTATHAYPHEEPQEHPQLRGESFSRSSLAVW